MNIEKLELYINSSKNELALDNNYKKLILELIKLYKEEKSKNVSNMDDWFNTIIKSTNISNSWKKLIVWIFNTFRDLEKTI